jgi:heme/copper-type cytochrome/quinol oxidase subunit 2
MLSKKIQAISASLLGHALLLTPLLVSAQASSGTSWGTGLSNAQAVGLPGGHIYQIIASTLAWLLAIFGFIAVIGFVISGVLYLTAAGNESQAEQAKNAMKYSIIGVIVALMGYVVIQAIDFWLSGTSTIF